MSTTIIFDAHMLSPFLITLTHHDGDAVEQAYLDAQTLIRYHLNEIAQASGAERVQQLFYTSALQNLAQDDPLSLEFVALARDTGRPLLDSVFSNSEEQQALLLSFAEQHQLPQQVAADIFQIALTLTLRDHALALDRALQAAEPLTPSVVAIDPTDRSAVPLAGHHITRSIDPENLAHPTSAISQTHKKTQSFWSQFALHGAFLLLVAVPILVFWTSCSQTKKTTQERQLQTANVMDSGTNDTTRPVLSKSQTSDSQMVPKSPAAHEIVPHNGTHPVTEFPEKAQPSQ